MKTEPDTPLTDTPPTGDPMPPAGTATAEVGPGPAAKAAGRDGTGRPLPVLCALLMLAAGLVSMLNISRRNSPVWDEVHFFGIGYYCLHTHQFNIPGACSHPPLSYYLNSLPLLAYSIPLPVFDPLTGTEFTPANLGSPDPDRGNRLLHALGFEPFFAGRVPFILAYGLLGFLVFLWSRQWFGARGGLFSLALYLLCPNLMAHGYVMTTDFLSNALVFAALFFLFRCLQQPGRGVLAGFLACLCLAPTVKLTGLLALPLAGLVVGVFAWTGKELPAYCPGRGVLTLHRPTYLLYWATVGLAAALGLYVAFVLVYQGDFGLRWLRISLAHLGLMHQKGHPVFLDGAAYQHGCAWYYYLAFLYKTSPAALAAWLLAAPVAHRRPARSWAALSGLALAAATALSFSGYTLGLRYVLVVFPLLYVAAGRLLPAAGEGSRTGRRLRTGLALAAVLACLAEQAAVWPFPRTYANPLLVRGPKYERLADTDMDWGEGLFALRDFMREANIRALPLSYNGSLWPTIAGVDTTWYENPLLPYRDLRPRPQHGLFAISSTNLSGLYFPPGRYAWLWKEKPLLVVGGTIYLYDLDRLPRRLDGTPRPPLGSAAR